MSQSLLLVVLTQFICVYLHYGSMKLLGAAIVVDRANWEIIVVCCLRALIFPCFFGRIVKRKWDGSTYLKNYTLKANMADHSVGARDESHRPLQKRERTGKEFGCFPFVWKTKTFKWKINYIWESLPQIKVFKGWGKWHNGSSSNITEIESLYGLGRQAPKL